MADTLKNLSKIGLVVIPVAIVCVTMLISGVALRATGQSIPDRSAPDRSTPVQTMSFQALKDTYTTSNKPDEGHGNEKAFWVGHNGSNGFGLQRSFIGFELNAIPARSTIVSASLNLYVGGTTTNDEPLIVSVRRANGVWAEEVTANTLEVTIDNQHSPTMTIPAVDDQLFTWDIQALVQKWINEDVASRGTVLSLRITGNKQSGDHERGFWSRNCEVSDCGEVPGKRPQLVITYSDPATPTATSTATPAPIPTVLPTPESNIALSIEIMSSEPANQSILPGESVNVDIRIQNGPVPVANAILTGTIPSGFQLAEHDADMASSTMLTWNIGDLAANAEQSHSYKIQRPESEPEAQETPTQTSTAQPSSTPTWTSTPTQTGEPTLTPTQTQTTVPTSTPTQTDQPSATPTTVTPTATTEPTPEQTPTDQEPQVLEWRPQPPETEAPGQAIRFQLGPPPEGSGYCYQWEMGDGNIYHLRDTPTFTYVYTDVDSYEIEVIVARQPDYLAVLTWTIFIEGESGSDILEPPEVDTECENLFPLENHTSTYQRSFMTTSPNVGTQGAFENIPISAGIQWRDGSEQKGSSVEVFVNPDTMIYLPRFYE
ncbi:MAG: DNRLRE domain-containing protein [Chloroflexota bacterium]